jgi:hypothetical protein
MKRICATLIGMVGATALLTTVGCFDPFYYGTRAGGEAVSDGVTFEGDVYPILLSKCSACHEAGGAASGTSYVLTSGAGADFDMINALVAPGDPAGSLLLQKPSGAVTHGGGGLLAETSVEYQTIAAWIEQGAVQQ